MDAVMKRIASFAAVLLLAAAIVPLGAQTAQAHEHFYFKGPDSGSVYKIGDSIPVSFFAGIVIKNTQFDAWGQPSSTTYETMNAQLKVFKGKTELYSQDFTYTSGETLEATYTPKTTGTLTLRIYGQRMALNDKTMVQYDSITVKVNKLKPASVKSIKPKISVDRVDKKAVEITCENDSGFGMKVFRADKKKGPYKLIKSTKKSTFTDKKVNAKKTYYYKVRLWAKGGSKTYLSKWSAAKKAGKFTARMKVVNAGAKGVKVSWMKIKGADYYLIARNSKGPSAEYDVISCEGADTLTFYDKDVTKGRTYYYMVLGQKGDDDVVGKYYGSKYKVKVS